MTFREHMEGWRIIVEVVHPRDVPDALEKALNDLDHPRLPYKTFKQLPKWWLDFQKKTGHRA